MPVRSARIRHSPTALTQNKDLSMIVRTTGRLREAGIPITTPKTTSGAGVDNIRMPDKTSCLSIVGIIQGYAPFV